MQARILAAPPKAKLFSYAIEIALAVFSFYLALTFFEVWAYFPFWVKDAALLTSLAAIYLIIRKAAKALESKSRYRSPAEHDLSRKGRARILHGVAFFSLTLAVWGGVQAGPGLPGRLVQAFTINLSQPPSSILVEATAIPPQYTNQDPAIFFGPDDGPLSRFSSRDAVTLPEGTIIDITLTVDGDIVPTVSLGNQWTRAEFAKERTFIAKLVVLEDATLDIEAGPYVFIQQKISVIPDENPAIAFDGQPKVTGRNTLAIAMTLGDDHGIDDVYLEISESGGERKDTFTLPVPYEGGSGNIAAVSYLNLLDNSLAGSRVIATLTAVDGVGQKTTSEPITLRLPEKTFTNEIAVDVISIRKALLVTPDRTSPQVNRLDRLTRDPVKFEDNKGVYLGLRSAYWRLRSAETQDDIDVVTRFLWQTALDLENDGSTEEERVRDLLDEMTADAFSGVEVKVFDKKADLLRKRLNTMIRIGFPESSRRFTMNGGVTSFDHPALRNFRDLIETARQESLDGHNGAALKALLEAKALFERKAF